MKIYINPTIKKNRVLFMIISLIFMVLNPVRIVYANEPEIINKEAPPESLSLKEFIHRVISNDPSFPVILSRELNLKFQNDLNLSPSDIVMDVSAQYDLFLPRDASDRVPWEGSISLSKLFASTGTSVSVHYSNSLYTGYNGTSHRSSAGFEISQSIAQNAFGILTRMQKEKIHIDNEIIRFQVIESYEDYLASLIQIYIDWYMISETIKVNEKSLNYTIDLTNTVARKQRYRIAHLDDLYKMQAEVLSEKEKLLELKASLKSTGEKIRFLTGFNQTESKNVFSIFPEDPHLVLPEIETYIGQKKYLTTRTFKILKKYEKSALVSKNIAERSMAPTVDFFTGYQARGEDYNIRNPYHTAYFGLRSSINFTRQQQKAEKEIKRNEVKIARIEQKKDMFNLKLHLSDLETRLRLQLEQIDLAQKRANLLKMVLDSERRKYNIGKKTLNDLIIAKKSLDNARHDIINYKMNYQSLILEWSCATDSLIDRKKSVILSNDAR